MEVPPFRLAVMVTTCWVATGVVVTVNAGLTVWPAATVTLAGTVTAALLEESATTVPPSGDAVLRVTVLLPNDKPPTISPPAR